MKKKLKTLGLKQGLNEDGIIVYLFVCYAKTITSPPKRQFELMEISIVFLNKAIEKTFKIFIKIKLLWI